MIQFKSVAHSGLILMLLLAVAFGAACKGGGISPIRKKAFEGEIRSKVSIGPDPVEVRYAFKGTRMRTETSFSGRMAGQSEITLTELSTGETTTLFPATKTYMTIGKKDVDEETVKKIQQGFQKEFGKITTNGKTETVAGSHCQYWQFGDKMEMCMAQGIGNSGGFLSQFKNLGQTDSYNDQLKSNPEYAKFIEGGAFPLKWNNIENGQSKTFMEVTGIEPKSLDDSLFTIPADYKKTDFPKMPDLSGLDKIKNGKKEE